MDKKPLTTVLFSHPQAGMTLIETVVALGILLVVSTGVMTVALVAVTNTETQGHLAARVAEYAQDKIEQLTGLSYGDAASDTRVFPAAAAGGTGLAIGGSSNPDAPVDGYTDYLDASGNQMALGGGGAPAGWYFKRVWEISAPAGTSNIKQLSVTSIVAYNAVSSGSGRVVRATLIGLKTSPF